MAKESIVIIDYGSGNLRSAAKAFERVSADEGLDVDVLVSSKPEDVLKADRIILPGQGAFADCMKGLSGIDGMIDALEESVIEKARPFLGICIGMQLMATRGLEHGLTAGLNWIPGEVVPLRPENKELKIPHMGWNALHQPLTEPQDNRHFVLRNVDSSQDYYFVHSFVFECKDSFHILGMTDYGGLIPAIVGRDNMIGMQFHPEKSQKTGLRLIAEFMQWKP